jgi:hypothetical protein
MTQEATPPQERKGQPGRNRSPRSSCPALSTEIAANSSRCAVCHQSTRMLERDDFPSNRHPALLYGWSVSFSDLPSPAEASSEIDKRCKASRKREAGIHPRLREGMLFGIMLYAQHARSPPNA